MLYFISLQFSVLFCFWIETLKKAVQWDVANVHEAKAMKQILWVFILYSWQLFFLDNCFFFNSYYFFRRKIFLFFFFCRYILRGANLEEYEYGVTLCHKRVLLKDKHASNFFFFCTYFFHYKGCTCTTYISSSAPDHKCFRVTNSKYDVTTRNSCLLYTSDAADE